MERIAAEFDFDSNDGAFEKLVSAAQAWERSEQAREIVDQEGPTVLDKFGQVKLHPAVLMQRDFSALFVRILRELSLSEAPTDTRPPQLKFGSM